MDSHDRNAFAFKLTGIVILAILATAAINQTRSKPAPSMVPQAIEAPSSETVVDPPVNAVVDRARARVNKLSLGSKLATSLAPISTRASGQVRQAADDSISRLKRIRGCEKSPGLGCPIESAAVRKDPAGYSNTLVDETVNELAFLKALAEAEAREHRRPTFSVEAVAKAYIRHRDDNVREQALLLASLIVESEPLAVVEIATRALSATISGPLADQALDLMYATRSANPELVDQTLIRTLKVGGWDVRDVVAGRILPFISSENRHAFAAVLEKAPNRSKLALHLKLGIEEFDRMERL